MQFYIYRKEHYKKFLLDDLQIKIQYYLSKIQLENMFHANVYVSFINELSHQYNIVMNAVHCNIYRFTFMKYQWYYLIVIQTRTEIIETTIEEEDYSDLENNDTIISLLSEDKQTI